MSWIYSGFDHLDETHFDVARGLSNLDPVSSNASKRRACRSDATTFEQNNWIFYIRWKNLDYRVASLSFVFFRHLPVLLMGRLISYINTGFFYKQHVYKQRQAEIGKKSSKS